MNLSGAILMGMLRIFSNSSASDKQKHSGWVTPEIRRFLFLTESKVKTCLKLNCYAILKHVFGAEKKCWGVDRIQ